MNTDILSRDSLVRRKKTIIYYLRESTTSFVMVAYSSFLLAFSAIASVLALPGDYNKRQTITTSQTGTNNGYYYSFWTNGGGTVDYTNGAAGEYSVTWENCGDFTSGKGWSTGSAR